MKVIFMIIVKLREDTHYAFRDFTLSGALAKYLDELELFDECLIGGIINLHGNSMIEDSMTIRSQMNYVCKKLDIKIKVKTQHNGDLRITRII